MKLGIDASSANKTERTGVEWYSYHLLREMQKNALHPAERVLLYSPKVLQEDLAELPQDWESQVLEWPLARGWMQGRMSMEMRINPPDVLFVPGQALPRILPKKTITTIHDIAFKRFPEVYDAGSRKHLERITADSLHRADHILTVSEFSKSELLSLYQIKEEKITVTPLALNTKMFQEMDKTRVREILDEHTLFRPYFLFVGRIEKKKNVKMLIDAFREFKNRTGSDAELILVGTPGFGFHEMFKPHPQGVRCLGYLSEEHLSAIMNGASAYCFPSWYEGFGIPNLEAMSCGTPLLTSDIPVHREVCGDAANFIPPNDPLSWSQAMERILEDREWGEALSDKGRVRAAEFSWEATAAKTWEAIRSLV